ncbi:hypothetical protein KEM54_005200 [Ascosphaera aggregata]|nr:hypothetical protein KEM54_005200 [Ascosphaera aggregata]
MPSIIAGNNSLTPNAQRLTSMTPSPDPFMPSRNVSAKQRYKRIDRSREADGYLTRSHRRDIGSSSTNIGFNNNDSRTSGYQSPMITRSQSRTQKPQSRASSRSRTGSLTPRATLVFRQSPDPREFDALDNFTETEDERDEKEENNDDDRVDEGYESPTKRLSDYSDDSSVSWLIERQLKGTIDASIRLPQQHRRQDTPNAAADARHHDGRIASARSSPIEARQNDLPVTERVPALRPIAEQEEEKPVTDGFPAQGESEVHVAEVQQTVADISERNGSFFRNDREVLPSQGFVNPKMMVAILCIVLLAGPVLLFKDTLQLLPAYFCSQWGFHVSPGFSLAPPPSSNSSHYLDALNRLSSEVDKQILHITRDINFLRYEWTQKLPVIKELADAFHQSPEPIADPLATPKVNFLSSGMGAKVDRDMTSPTRCPPTTNSFTRIFRAMSLGKSINGPETVLESWHDVGDCWCSHMSHNGMQITIKLGKAIVPDEIIVEHVPQSTILDSDSTPKDMELWVQYIFQAPGEAPGSTAGTLLSLDPSMVKSVEEHHEQRHRDPPQSAYSAAEAVYAALQSSFSDDDASTSTNDPLLGPTFFKIANWRYDINNRYHIQSFTPDVVIDLPGVRIVQAVFRTATTWSGEKRLAPYVCLYRLRLHGHT